MSCSMSWLFIFWHTVLNVQSCETTSRSVHMGNWQHLIDHYLSSLCCDLASITLNLIYLVWLESLLFLYNSEADAQVASLTLSLSNFPNWMEHLCEFTFLPNVLWAVWFVLAKKKKKKASAGCFCFNSSVVPLLFLNTMIHFSIVVFEVFFLLLLAWNQR